MVQPIDSGNVVVVTSSRFHEIKEEWEMAFVHTLDEHGNVKLLDLLERREWPTVWAMFFQTVRS